MGLNECCINYGCDCTDTMFMSLTGHHPACKNAPDARTVFNMSKVIVDALINGINAWQADEDGVHPEVWDAYVNACKIYQGYFHFPKEEVDDG